MKMLLGALAVAFLLWPACKTRHDPESLNVDNATETARQEKQVYQYKIEARLHDLDQEIDALKTKMQEQKKVDHNELDQQVAELDQTRADAHQQLDSLENSNKESWLDMRAGIDATLNDLETEYKKAISHFQ